MSKFVVINDERHRRDGWKITLDDESIREFTSPRQLINFCKANPDTFAPGTIFIFDRMYGTYDLTEDIETWEAIKSLVPDDAKHVISSFTVQEGQQIQFSISADLVISGKALSKRELINKLAGSLLHSG